MSRLRLVRRHVPAALATIAFGIGAIVWLWAANDTAGIVNVFAGWRQIMIVACAGIVLGGAAAECFALLAGTSPAEAPVGSTVIALVIAVPFYVLSILFSAAGTG